MKSRLVRRCCDYEMEFSWGFVSQVSWEDGGMSFPRVYFSNALAFLGFFQLHHPSFLFSVFPLLCIPTTVILRLFDSTLFLIQESSSSRHSPLPPWWACIGCRGSHGKPPDERLCRMPKTLYQHYIYWKPVPKLTSCRRKSHKMIGLYSAVRKSCQNLAPKTRRTLRVLRQSYVMEVYNSSSPSSENSPRVKK